jgi:hypothetical protein
LQPSAGRCTVQNQLPALDVPAAGPEPP